MDMLSFDGTPEQEEQLKAVFEKYKGVGGELMPVLQEAQAIYGYLPIEVQTMIADALDISLSEVYGVATFYSQFNLYPMASTEFPFASGLHAMLRVQRLFLRNLRRSLELKTANAHLTENSALTPADASARVDLRLLS